MATLILSTVAAHYGFSSWLAVAAVAVGGYIDSQIVGALAGGQSSASPRLSEIQLTTSTEGSPIKRLYGTVKLGGQMIWATNFKETVRTEKQSGGGKGGGSVRVTNYTYSISFAIAFCEGNAATRLGRVWADSDILDLSKYNYRFYSGSLGQMPDSLIEQIEGAQNVSGYRGVTYIVFEDMPLGEFGNRIPQITAEIIKPIINDDVSSLENLLGGVSLIPSTGEFVYSTTPTLRATSFSGITSEPENIHRNSEVTDVELALNDLDVGLPNVKTVNLVVGWFGSDLRCGECRVEPKVSTKIKPTRPKELHWAVNGLSRESANAVTVDEEDKPNYGGTPSDHSIVEIIAELKSRNKKISFYPFLLMDIAHDNNLPNPYSPNASQTGQPAFPWRGRITCSPAPGYAGTVDKTSAAAAQVASFIGNATVADFKVEGTKVSWKGGNEWSIRRMILHYALLCKAAGGVDYFLVGTEMVGFNSIRSSASYFPGAQAYSQLITDVKAILGPDCEVAYAADWSEYHSYRPGDGSGDVYFNLDPIWSNPDCAFIGIDNYLPMSDWRDGNPNIDRDPVNGPTRIYDKSYLARNIEGGEYYDWYYANATDRANQIRTPITDGSYNKPWVYRNKDVRNWWSNPHHNRPGGVESGTPTSWVPGSKRVVFTEFGCPAIDKGTNQPNVFVDPKSSESFVPHFSTGRRDDTIQRMYLEVFLKYWADQGDGMVALEDCWAWTWDARPFPEFPSLEEVWSDAPNYNLGHWLNGRVGGGGVTLAALVREIMSLVGLEHDIDVSGLTSANTVVSGYLIDSLASPRDLLNPLFSAYFFDAYETGGIIRFVMRSNTQYTAIDLDSLVVEDSNPGGYGITRRQNAELPRSSTVSFIDSTNEYYSGAATGLRPTAQSDVVVDVKYALVLSQEEARNIADGLVHEAWAQREGGELRLPPSMTKFDPTDGLVINIKDRTFVVRVTNLENGSYRKVDFLTHDSSIYGGMAFNGRPPTGGGITVYGPPVVEFMDIPLLVGDEPRPWAPRVGAAAIPFPPSVDIYIQDPTTSGLTLLNQISSPIQMGTLINPVDPYPAWRYDRGGSLMVQVANPSFQPISIDPGAFLAGANALAVKNENDRWEIIQYRTVDLVDGTTYNLRDLLRGQLGTEADMAPIAANARVVFLDSEALSALALSQGQRSLTFDYRYGPSGSPTDGISYDTETLTFRSVGLMPYAPTDLRLVRTAADGTLRLSWIRRTRFGGDEWDDVDAPLNETFERYELEIMSGSTVVRLVSNLSSSEYIYPPAQQIADFGSVQTSLRVRVYQMSEIVGRGHPADQIVSF